MTINPLTGKSKLAVQHSTATLNVYEGSVRSGKTIATLIDWIRFCRTGPAGNLLMTGKTERTVINNLVLPIQDMLGTSRVKINRGNGTVDICGRTVLIIGANNEQARTKIQGLTLAGAYVDEASTLPESFWSMLTSRLSVEGAKLLATCNPEGPQHWFKIDWLDRAKLWVDHSGNVIDRSSERELLDPDDPARPIDLHRFSYTLEDNRANLDPTYYENVMTQYSGLWYQRMILGLWTMADGIVFESFNPDVHVVDELPAILRVFSVGVDYGTTNPTAGIMCALGSDHRLYLTAEWAPHKGTDGALSVSLRSWLAAQPSQPEFLFVDPAAASFKLQLNTDGIPSVFNAANDVVAGIRTVDSLLSTDQLRIHSSCTQLLKELPGYVWDAKASENGEDKPVKLNDHHIDAMRYAIASARPWWSTALRTGSEAA